MAESRCRHLTVITDQWPENYPARCGECGIPFPDAESRTMHQLYAYREGDVRGSEGGQP